MASSGPGAVPTSALQTAREVFASHSIASLWTCGLRARLMALVPDMAFGMFGFEMAWAAFRSHCRDGAATADF